MKKIMLALTMVFIGSSILLAGETSTLIKICSACHGSGGISANDTIPNLAGQKAEYMAIEIKAIRDGVRKNSMMDAVVKGLTDQQIDKLASYFSNLEPKKEIGNEVNQQGKNTRAVCISCHGVNGITVNDQWPNLAGQKKAYFQAQLIAFRDDIRIGSNMQVIAKELTEAQIEAVAEYYSQLPGGK